MLLCLFENRASITSTRHKDGFICVLDELSCDRTISTVSRQDQEVALRQKHHINHRPRKAVVIFRPRLAMPSPEILRGDNELPVLVPQLLFRLIGIGAQNPSRVSNVHIPLSNHPFDRVRISPDLIEQEEGVRVLERPPSVPHSDVHSEQKILPNRIQHLVHARLHPRLRPHHFSPERPRGLHGELLVIRVEFPRQRIERGGNGCIHVLGIDETHACQLGDVVIVPDDQLEIG